MTARQKEAESVPDRSGGTICGLLETGKVEDKVHV